MADFILSVPLGTASSCISTTCSTSRIHETHKKFRFYPTEGSCWRTEENVRKIIWPVFLTQCWPAEASFIHSEKQEQTQLLTNNGDAAFSSYFYHFVHQGFGSFGKLVPLKDPNWTVPHDLLGPSHNFHKLFHTLRATVQALREVREGTDTLTADPSSNHPCPARSFPLTPDMKQEFLCMQGQICQQLLQEGGVWCGIYLPNTSKSISNQCQILEALVRKLCQCYLNSSQIKRISIAFRSASWRGILLF